MKLHLLSLLLAQGLIDNAIAQFHRVKINNVQPESEKSPRKLTNFQCTLMIKAVKYGDEEGGIQHVEEVPECHLEGSTLPTPLVNMPSWLSEKFVNHEVVSNLDSIELSEALVYDEGIYIPNGAQASFVKGSEERRNRLLNQAQQASRSVVAMRITNSGNSDPSESNSALSDSIFGNGNDNWNLKNAYAACTYNELTFTKGTGNGILDVSTAATNNDNAIIEEALSNLSLSPDSYNHVSTCNSSSSKLRHLQNSIVFF